MEKLAQASQVSKHKIPPTISTSTNFHFVILLLLFELSSPCFRCLFCRSLKQWDFKMWPRGPCSCWMRYPGKEASLRRNSSRRPTPALEFLDRFNQPLFFSLNCALTFSVACHSYCSFISKWPFQEFLGLSGLSDRINRWMNKAKQPGSSHIPVVSPFVTVLLVSNKIAVQACDH